MNTVHLDVRGMSCGGCVKNVNAALKPLPGVGYVDVDLAAGRVTVTGDLVQGGEKLALALTAAGYPAKLIDASDIAVATGASTEAAPGAKKSGGCCG